VVSDLPASNDVAHIEEWIRLPGHHLAEGNTEHTSSSSNDNTSGTGTMSRSVSEIEELIIERLIEIHDGWVHEGNDSK
jgi:hypothetical protein